VVSYTYLIFCSYLLRDAGVAVGQGGSKRIEGNRNV